MELQRFKIKGGRHDDFGIGVEKRLGRNPAKSLMFQEIFDLFGDGNRLLNKIRQLQVSAKGGRIHP